MIAHLQIASLLENARAPLAENHRAGVYLTNALTGWVPEEHPQSVIFEEFRHEREDSEHIKQQGPILVILGNPPYNGYAGIAKIEEERDLTIEYRAPVEGLPAPQGQGLNDLYIRFFRIAERRIAANADGKGIVCFISNYSWLDGLSHPTMRHRYLNTFANIYIDNLHGDRKISEYAPDGRTSETIFAVTGTSVGIRIGTAISTLVRNTRSGQKPAVVHYRDFDDARASERREALTQSIASHEPRYGRLPLSSTLGLPFKPRIVGTDYLQWPRVPELFPESFPGVQSGRDDLVIDISSEQLEKRMRSYLNPKFSHAEMDTLVPGTMIDTKRFQATEVRVELQARGFRSWQILPFAYRPYDSRWLYWEPTTKLLDEKREEYVRQYRTDVPVMYLAQKNRKAFDPPGITYLVANRHLNERGANVFPLSTMGEPLPGHVESRVNVSEAGALYLNEIETEHPSLFFPLLSDHAHAAVPRKKFRGSDERLAAHPPPRDR